MLGEACSGQVYGDEMWIHRGDVTRTRNLHDSAVDRTQNKWLGSPKLRQIAIQGGKGTDEYWENHNPRHVIQNNCQDYCKVGHHKGSGSEHKGSSHQGSGSGHRGSGHQRSTLEIAP